jgi:hypothetical protein
MFDDSDNRIPGGSGAREAGKDTQSDEGPGVRLSDLMQSLVGMNRHDGEEQVPDRQPSGTATG